MATSNRPQYPENKPAQTNDGNKSGKGRSNNDSGKGGSNK